MFALAAAVRALYDRSAPVRSQGSSFAGITRIPVGKDYWSATMQNVKHGEGHKRCVVISRTINGYSGGTDKEIWYVPFEAMDRITTEFEGWHEMRTGLARKSGASV